MTTPHRPRSDPPNHPDLGPCLSTHPVDARRRARLGALALVFGIVVWPLGVVMAIPAYNTSNPGDDFVPSVVLGAGVAGVVIGVILLLLARARRGEHFLRHEHGLVHNFGTTTRTLRWTEVASLGVQRNDNAFARYFGGSLACWLRPHTGRAMYFNALTADAPGLLAAVDHALPASVPRTGPPGRR